MANELITVETIKGVSQAVGSLVSAYRESHIINKAKKSILNDRIRVYKSMQHINAVAAIARNNIQEISKTMDLINNLNLNGSSLDLAMKQLELMSNSLSRILEDYDNGL